MDLYPAPLSITKRSSLPVVQIEHDYSQNPLLNLDRGSSTQSSAPTSSSDSTAIASHSPPLRSGWSSLDIPKIRRSNTKSGSQLSEKGTRRRGLTRPTYNTVCTPESHAERASISSFSVAVESRFQNQQTEDNADSQTQGRVSQFFHALDKRLSRHSMRGFSKRFSSNTRSTCAETEDHNYSPWKYNFAPPISVVNMEIHVDKSLRDLRRTETSVHITIMADVNMESARALPYSLDIDAMILLNMTSDSDMARVTAMAQVIIDKLKTKDSFAVACVNFDQHDSINILFSSSEGRNLCLKGLLSECTSAGKQLINGAFRDDGLLEDAVETVSRLFDTSDHSAPHIFLVSANHDTTLSATYNAAVGLTTVTMEDHYESGPTPRRGWHIYPEITADPSSALDFKNKVEKALCHIRSGFNPGTITNLRVKLTPSSKCDIRVCGKTSIASLRPGEMWKILLRVSIPEEQGFGTLERDIRSLLRCDDVPGEVDGRGPALVATLKFNHSLQPTSSSKIVKSCRVLRG